MYPSTLKALAVSLLLAPLNAYVIPPADNRVNLAARAAVGSTPVAQLTAMLADPNTCPTSTGECVTPADAVIPIISGLNKYNILTAPEQAAIVSLMAFESVDFKYNRNVFPGRVGQGTRAMLMPNFVKEYAQDLPELKQKAAAVADDPAALLVLVQDNTHSFAAASWFYSTKCSDDVKEKLKEGGEAGWTNYLKTCVGVDATADRKAYWQRACEQLSVPSS